MKYLIILFALTITINLYSQKKSKIKGDKEVVDVFKNIESFNEIELSDGLDVFLMQSSSSSYQISADSNLINVIKLEVIDSVLKVYTTNRIVSSKKAEVHINFRYLDRIIINGSKAEGKNNFNFNDVKIEVFQNSSFDFDIKAESLVLFMNNSSNGKLKLKSKKSEILLNNNALVKGNIVSDSLKLTVNKRADMKIEGNVDKLDLIATGSSDIKAKNLSVKYANLNASNSSDIYINTSKELNVYAKGKSFIYVFGNPEIKINGLNDKSRIIKK